MAKDYTTATPEDLEKLKRLHQERLDAVHCAGQVLRDEGFTERFKEEDAKVKQFHARIMRMEKLLGL